MVFRANFALRAERRFVTTHEVTHLLLGFRPDTSATAQCPHEMPIAQRISAKPGGSDLGVSLEKSFDIVEQRSHE